MNSLDLKADSLSIALKAVQLYAETHPRPGHVTQSQAAEMLDCSTPTVGRMIKAGILSLNKSGRIPTYQVDAAIAARNNAQKAA